MLRLVVVDDRASAADAACGAGGVEAVLRPPHDVVAPIFGKCEDQVEDEGAFGVLAGGDAVQDLDLDAALEEVVEDDQLFEVGRVQRCRRPRSRPGESST
ncbi:hypothetical protein AB0P21_39400 [Kribbella sp. NPDC056861]|uniref:hypothetical protein n=1 Tax=Kribbella sp. NPDC056861 TaxID=3154857 RepID=UPI00341C9B54